MINNDLVILNGMVLIGGRWWPLDSNVARNAGVAR
jgi:hypothetical protein